MTLAKAAAGVVQAEGGTYKIGFNDGTWPVILFSAFAYLRCPVDRSGAEVSPYLYIHLRFSWKFIQQHSISEKSNPTCVKKVAYDGERKEYIQLQAVLPVGGDYWIIQKFDNELVYMGEIWPGCRYRDEVQDWMRTNFDIEKCLMAHPHVPAPRTCWKFPSMYPPGAAQSHLFLPASSFLLFSLFLFPFSPFC